MDLFQSLILSIIEGVTEFLPVSSTGHLVLASGLLKIPQTEFVKSFEIFIQLGAILAVVVLYFKKYIQNFKAWKNILIAFVPTAVIGFVLYKIVKQFLLGNSLVVVASLLVGGILLIWLEKIHKEKDSDVGKIENLSSKQSFMIGLAQSISIIPGVSRAAATILGGMFLGLKKETAVEFSFLLAVPTMLAATGLDLVKSDLNFSAQELSVLAVGFIGSFIAALLVVKWFIKFIQTNNFFWFGVYRIILAVIFLFLLS
ncbi:MAG TPA: undecaprenyl-diphosphate phosphatase [Patescibacteria group bacterium]|nr:undecaprenyl-diphosphate phosphatase [Patescibacteria group bacterium]